MDAQERIARNLAHWHGQKIVSRDHERTWITVASRRQGTVYNADGQTEKYVNDHWRECLACVDYVLEHFEPKSEA
jgi:hypothetical protein